MSVTSVSCVGGRKVAHQKHPVNIKIVYQALALGADSMYCRFMDTQTRLNLVVSPQLYADLQEIAADSHATMSQVIRMAFALYKVCHEAKKAGQHIGLTKDPKRLDRELVGLF